MKELATKEQEETKGESLRVKKAEDIVDRVQQTFDLIAKRAYEIFKNSGHTFGHDLEDWFKAESDLLHPVHIELKETDGAISVRAEVPGFTADEVDIALEPRRLTIRGKKETKSEEKKGQTIYTECSSNQFLRVLDLPAEADLDKTATATLKNGILELEIPKAAARKKVPIESKAA